MLKPEYARWWNSVLADHRIDLKETEKINKNIGLCYITEKFAEYECDRYYWNVGNSPKESWEKYWRNWKLGEELEPFR